MRQPLVVITSSLLIILLAAPVLVWADSLTLLGDLKFTAIDSLTTYKDGSGEEENYSETVNQLYSLDIRKEIFPTMQLNTGGVFDLDRTRTEPDSGEETVARERTARPFIDLRYDSPLLDAVTGYRKTWNRSQPASGDVDRTYFEEYTARLNWEPVRLPQTGLFFTRNLVYNDDNSTDLSIDNYQLTSDYGYRNFKFNYNHITSDTEDKGGDISSQSDIDTGSIRFARTYQQGRLSVNSSLRGSQQKVTFEGSGDRRVPTDSQGTPIGQRDETIPPDDELDDNFSLSDIDLLADLTTEQFSFGLDFSAPTTVDTLLVNFSDLQGYQANQFSWRVYIRDRTDSTWQELAVTAATNEAYNRFELSFPQVETELILVVTRQVVADGEDLFISGLVPQRTLSPETNSFSSSDWTSDLAVIRKLSDRTTLGANLLYREKDSSDSSGVKQTTFNSGVWQRHIFNEVFSSNLQLQRQERRREGKGSNINHSFSSALTAKYLETFDQRLTWSLSHQSNEQDQTTEASSLFLRSNLDLYQGLSLYLDNGVNWQKPVEGGDRYTSFTRIGSNIVPNNWLNTTLSYSISETRQKGEEDSREQDARAIISLVPTSSISFLADLSLNDKEGAQEQKVWQQQYFFNWALLRDGNLSFTLAYAQSENERNETTWSLAPRLRWKVNNSTLLTFEYSLGEREDDEQLVEYETASLALRIFY